MHAYTLPLCVYILIYTYIYIYIRLKRMKTLDVEWNTIDSSTCASLSGEGGRGLIMYQVCW